jgi:hypothetical protein
VPPLAEPDIFRALIFLPGVSQPNDLKGRIHLAGGASDETGVRLDGHPLQDPFHLLGVLGAFNVAALDRADVLIHHLPTHLEGQLSGVIDMRTRATSDRATGEAVISVLSGSTTVSVPTFVLGTDVLASVRTTYFDKILEALAPDARLGGDQITLLGYRDALLRLGRSWGGGWSSEVLAFTTRDVIRTGGIEPSVNYRPLTWGESMGGVRLEYSSTRWAMSARAALNRATVSRYQQQGAQPESISIARTWASGAFEVGWVAERWRTRAGASFDMRHHAQAWQAIGTAVQVLAQSAPPQYAGREQQQVTAVFTEASRELSARWLATAGTRISWVANRAYASPRTVLGMQATKAVRVEAAFDRRHQFDAQLEEPIEGSVTPPVFLLARPRIADVFAASAKWYPPADSTTSVKRFELAAFSKMYRQRTIIRDRIRAGASEEPSGVPAVAFPTFTRVPGRSIGATIAGNLTFARAGLLQGSYTYQRAVEDVGEERSPTSWDAPHALSAFTSVPLPRRWTLNGTFQARTGAATTPVEARLLVPDLTSPGFVTSRYIRGARNSARLPSYRRLDVGARRQWQARGATWTFSAQVLNVLLRQNAIEYDWYSYFCHVARECDAQSTARKGLPVTPSIGLEVRW